MKFASFDELIRYLVDKDFNALEFNIEETEVDATDNEMEPVPDSEIPPETSKPNLDGSKVKVAFNSLSDNPVVEFELGPTSILAVAAFDYVPNACSTSKISFCDRSIVAGICESADGKPVVKFDVTVNGKLYSNKSFILSSSPTAKNIIAI